MQRTKSAKQGSAAVVRSAVCGWLRAARIEWVMAALPLLMGVNAEGAPVVNNPGFEDDGSIAIGYMAITNWTQSPFPSGYPAVDYLTGLSQQQDSGIFDNGIIPDGIEAAFITVAGVVNTLALQQTVSGFTVGKVYQLQYYENGSANPAVKQAKLTVTIDGAINVAAHVVTNVDATGVHSHPFTLVKGYPFVATSASMTLSFASSSQNSGEEAYVILDKISFAEITEPTVINPSFEYGVSVATFGYMAVTNWTQAPYPSGYPGYPYLTGLAPQADSNPFDNGIIPDGIEAAFITVAGSYVPALALQQTVYGFIVGKTYQLQYYENTHAGAGPAHPFLTVTINGATNVPTHVVTNVDAEGVHSHPFTLVKGEPFVATSTTNTFAFTASQQTPGDEAYVILDKISFTNIIPRGTIFSIR